jgi:hypothetical protein
MAVGSSIGFCRLDVFANPTIVAHDQFESCTKPQTISQMKHIFTKRLFTHYAGFTLKVLLLALYACKLA